MLYKGVELMITIPIPVWLKKPEHPERLVATDRGWEVEKTGEILVSMKNLDYRIKEYVKELEKVVKVAKEATKKKPGPKPKTNDE
jgi:hypothetical protein